MTRNAAGRKFTVVLSVAMMAVGLAACREQAEPTGAPIEVPDPVAAPEHEDILVPSDNDRPAQPPDQLLGPLLDDAAQRTGLEAGALVISRALRVTWSDGSLGCPQPGMHYTQALVPGWHVHITAGDEVLDYRLTDRGSFLLCPGGVAGRGQVIDER
jgi:hypothetical protein